MFELPKKMYFELVAHMIIIATTLKITYMQKLISIVALVLVATMALAQSKQSKKFAKSINENDLYNRLAVLASDSLEGRETGTAGQKKAADYISSRFKEFGFEGPVKSNEGSNYYQKFNLYKLNDKDIYISAGDKKLEFLSDFMSFGGTNTEGEVSKQVVYLGDGTNIDSVDLKGKIGSFYTSKSNWRDIAAKITEAGAEGTLAFMGATDDIFDQSLNRMKSFIGGNRLTLNKPAPSTDQWLFFVPPSFANELFNKPLDSLKQQSDISGITGELKISLNRSIQTVESENVLGYLPGTDLKDELLVITSHYDHLGVRDGEVYNGADDDGSGTTSLLEIAQAFSLAKAKGKGPRRSILFMTVSGEEKGLLGSDYYTQNPVFDLTKTVTNLNIDMVGRVDPDHEGKPDYVYVIGADKLSTELHELSEEINSNTLKLDFDYKYNDENDPNRFYYRSDHYNFAKNNIPIIFYFNGVHADYHKPTDTVEKINLTLMKKRAQVIFYTAWEIANRDSRVKLD